jgi:hypothetical protein
VVAWQTALAAVQGNVQAAIRGWPLNAVDLLRATATLEGGRTVASGAVPVPRGAAAPLPRTC